MTGTIQSESAHPETIQLAIIACRRLDGDALAAMFLAHAYFNVLCTTTSVDVAAAVGQHRRLDVVLLDAHFIRPLVGQQPALLSAQLGKYPILILDDEVHHGRLASVLSEPRVGYFTKRAPFAELSAGIRRMVGGERAFDAAVEAHIHKTSDGWQFRTTANDSILSKLTSREIEVLKLVALGHSIEHCAQVLQIAPSTVDNHKARVMKKLGVHKALDLTRFAIREGLVEN